MLDFLKAILQSRTLLWSLTKNEFKQKYIGNLLGIFWAFIPMPMQMLAVLTITPFIKFNVPIAISMVWLSNPLTMPFMYYMEYQTGSFLLGNESLDDIELTLAWFSANWDKIITPLYVGTIPYSLGISSIVYFIINKLWIDSVKKENHHRVRRFRKFKNKKIKDIEN